jgi:beta-barrel assembly-enhancing protease
MDYANPQIPEGINVDSQHPLKDFVWMLGTVGVACVAIVALLTWAAEYLVRYIPFETEQRLVARVMAIAEDDAPATATVSYLRQLTQTLAAAQQAPFPVHLHYLDTEQVNAYATLGGHIVITRGLLEAMPSENALAMVLAHEIAHISHRDPMVAAGRGLTVGLAVMSLAGGGDGALAQQLIGHLNTLTQLTFSRSAESAADARALATLVTHYGHVRDADALFNYLLETDQASQAPALLSTHPLHEDRIKAIAAFAARYASPANTLTPLAVKP